MGACIIYTTVNKTMTKVNVTVVTRHILSNYDLRQIL